MCPCRALSPVAKFRRVCPSLSTCPLWGSAPPLTVGPSALPWACELGSKGGPGAHTCGLCLPELYLDESKQFYKELGFKR